MFSSKSTTIFVTLWPGTTRQHQRSDCEVATELRGQVGPPAVFFILKF